MKALRKNMAGTRAEHRLKILWRGFIRAVYGAAVTGALAAAIYGMFQIEFASGWLAVCRFVVSCMILTVAAAYMYLMGE